MLALPTSVTCENKMENFIAIVKSTGGKLDKYQDFAVEADAVSHVATYAPDTGFVAPDPGGSTSYWVVDAEAQTVTNDQAQADADALASSWERLRTERNALLTESDWTQYNDSPLDDETKDDWITYRQQLRDRPATEADPANPSWPTPPE
jgi:hypothetical protein